MGAAVTVALGLPPSLRPASQAAWVWAALLPCIQRAFSRELIFSEQFRQATEIKGSSSSCWDGQYSFSRCCHTYNDIARLTGDSALGNEAGASGPAPLSRSRLRRLKASGWAQLADDSTLANLQLVFVERVLRILDGEQPLHGLVGCWGGELTYERCCSLNIDYGLGVEYSNAFRVMLTPWAKLVMVQGAALDNYMDPQGKRSLPFGGPIPYQGVQSGDGEGIIWATGVRAAMAFAQLDLNRFFNASSAAALGWRGAPRRRGRGGGRRNFLEVAAGTGVPSLVALARGFAVWSTDVRTESSWQRRASVRATFGSSSEQRARFFTPTLNLLDEFTWPAARPEGGGFDVILLSGSFPQKGEADWRRGLCEGFKRLLRRLLLPGGVGLYGRNAGTLLDLNASNDDAACIRPDKTFDVVAHRQDATGRWHSHCLRAWTPKFASLAVELCPERCLSIISLHRRAKGRRRCDLV